MRSGSLKFYLEDRGYGFIQPEGGGEDIFLHATVIRTSGFLPEHLRKNDKLRFEAGPGKKGEQATKIERA